jgi:hypothetical protein
METKTKTADTTVRASFALIQGAVIGMAYPLFFFILPGYVQAFPGLFLGVVIPILSFLSALLLNWFLQYMYCKGVDVGAISMASAISPLMVYILGGLAYFLSFLRTPINQLFTELPQDSPQEAVFARELWGYAFYLFWAGVYGQTLGSGMIATCP